MQISSDLHGFKKFLSQISASHPVDIVRWTADRFDGNMGDIVVEAQQEHEEGNLFEIGWAILW